MIEEENEPFRVSRIVPYFIYGILFGVVVGYFNSKISILKKRNAFWEKYLNLLDIERKTVHVLSWFAMLLLHELSVVTPNNTRFALLIFCGVGLLTIGNLFRLYFTPVRKWIEKNWHGLLRENEKDSWPAIFPLLLAVCISNYTVQCKAIVM